MSRSALLADSREAKLGGQCDPELAAAERGGGLAASARCRGLRAAGRQAARPIRPAHRQGAAADLAHRRLCRALDRRPSWAPTRKKARIHRWPCSCARASPRSPPMSAARPPCPASAQPAKLSSNENPLGPSPKAIAAFREASADLHRYPDGGAERLRAGHRPALRPGGRADRLRHRLRRADRAC